MQFLHPFPQARPLGSRFAIVGIVLILLTSLAACGGSPSSSSGGTTASSSGPVNLAFWRWVPGIDKSIAEWNQTHPNIHVTLSNVGSGPAEYDKLYTAIKANNE